MNLYEISEALKKITQKKLVKLQIVLEHGHPRYENSDKLDLTGTHLSYFEAETDRKTMNTTLKMLKFSKINSKGICPGEYSRLNRRVSPREFESSYVRGSDFQQKIGSSADNQNDRIRIYIFCVEASKKTSLLTISRNFMEILDSQEYFRRKIKKKVLYYITKSRHFLKKKESI